MKIKEKVEIARYKCDFQGCDFIADGALFELKVDGFDKEFCFKHFIKEQEWN